MPYTQNDTDYWIPSSVTAQSKIALAFRRRGETLPSRQLRVLLMYAVAFHSWWLRHRYKETHHSTHTHTHAHTLHAHVEGPGSWTHPASVDQPLFSVSHINTDTDSNQPSVSLSSFHFHKIFMDSWVCPLCRLGEAPQPPGYQNNTYWLNFSRWISSLKACLSFLPASSFCSVLPSFKVKTLSHLLLFLLLLLSSSKLSASNMIYFQMQ